MPGQGFKSPAGHTNLYKKEKNNRKNEKKFKTLEKEKTNALEMAAQKNEKRKAKESYEIKLKKVFLSISKPILKA